MNELKNEGYFIADGIHHWTPIPTSPLSLLSKFVFINVLFAKASIILGGGKSTVVSPSAQKDHFLKIMCITCGH